MSPVSSRDFFAEFEGREFADYRDLQRAVLEKFNQRLASFPPQYTYLQLIEWAKRQKWIVRKGESGYLITVR